MTLSLLWRTTLLLLTVLLTGCSGYDRALLVTKTNVGLDIDSTPPTSEITIARRELAIQPTFPEYGSKESALPLLGTFGLGGSYFNPNITGHFAGGDAAVNLTKEEPPSKKKNESKKDEEKTGTREDDATADDGVDEMTGETGEGEPTSGTGEDEAMAGTENGEATTGTEDAEAMTGANKVKDPFALCLGDKPDTRSPLRKFWHFITFHDYENQGKDKESNKGEGKESDEETSQGPRPFYFATDTSYGVKVAWNGTGGPYPDSLKLGYNRKEYASAPIFVDGLGTCHIEARPKKGDLGYKVKMPSFYAAIDNASGFETYGDNEIEHVQFFATGKAANQFAANKHVRAIAFRQMAPKAAKLKASRLGLNQELIKEIEVEFTKSNTIKKTAIKMTAKDLELVDEESITDSEFVGKLKEYWDSPDPEISKRLIQVRRVVVASPEASEEPEELATPE